MTVDVSPVSVKTVLGRFTATASTSAIAASAVFDISCIGVAGDAPYP